MAELGHISLHPDDELLVDYFCGQLDNELSDSVAHRLATDDEFAARGAKINKLFMLMDTCPAAAPTELLISRTLAAVGAERATEKLASRKLVFGSGGALAFGMREVGALAALVFIVAAILIPVFNHAGRFYHDEVCIDRTGKIGQAMASYAGDNAGGLPATANMDAGWLNSAADTKAVSNSSNLWKLVSGEYVPVSTFVCPADENAAAQDITQIAGMNDFAGPENISYSYQNAVNSAGLKADLAKTASNMAILADRSPVFVAGSFVQGASQANSANHGGHGQAVLYLDMHSVWADSPNAGINADNIWLSGQQSQYKGNEKPASLFDSFLLPSHLGQ